MFITSRLNNVIQYSNLSMNEKYIVATCVTFESNALNYFSPLWVPGLYSCMCVS